MADCTFKEVKPGTVYIADEPRFVGKVVVRPELHVIGPDSSKAFSVFDELEEQLHKLYQEMAVPAHMLKGDRRG